MTYYCPEDGKGGIPDVRFPVRIRIYVMSVSLGERARKKGLEGLVF
jgi:hypothetical protein